MVCDAGGRALALTGASSSTANSDNLVVGRFGKVASAAPVALAQAA
jgi:hypothetical protein